MRTTLTLGLAAAVVLGPRAGLGGRVAGAARAQPLRVVVAESMWASIVAQVGGRDTRVESIVAGPDADPHDYEPTASDARAVAEARYVVENGGGYDPWMQQLVDVDPGQSRTVLDVCHALGVADGGNPHQWYAATSVRRVVARVARDLGRLDPAHASAYAARARAFTTRALARYDSLVAEIRGRWAGTPVGGSESIVAPLATTLGLRLVTPTAFLDAVSEGAEPSARAKTTADAQIAAKRMAVFVENSQNTTPDVQELVRAARREGIPVVTVTETLVPEHATYQSWQVAQLQRLRAALQRATDARKAA